MPGLDLLAKDDAKVGVLLREQGEYVCVDGIEEFGGKLMGK